LVPERTFAEKLEKNYRISGKTFFDQGSSDLTVGFATLMPRSEIEKITATAISSERLISSIMALSLILSFSLIIFMITRHIRQLNTRVNAFSENTLKIKVPGRQKGDELLALEKEFVNLSRAITEARDIMKRQADELLSEKTVYLNNIMQSSPMAIAATDLNFVIKYYNPVAEKFFGHTADEVVGRAVPHIHEKLKVDPSRFERAIEIVKQGKIYLYNVEVKTESGVRFLESRVSGILDDGGKLIGFVLMSSDVTDKIKAEEKIKTLAKFPDENPYPVLRISLEGVLSYSNKASAPLLDLWGCSSSGTVPEHLRQLISQILESGDEREIELAVDERFFSLIIVPVADEGYVNMYGRDVSLKKQMEEKLRTYSLELERSNKELELFASIAAHDLQEPLRGVSGFAGLLKKRYMGKLDQDGDEFISYIVDGAERMQQLIRDLLAYSRVTTSGKAFTPVDCNNAVRAALDNLRISIDESGSVITFKPLPVVNADKGQIIRLFQNLIGNAIKYRGDSKPAIAVSAEKQGDEWVFSVADNGIGIDAQYYARIFQIFQRLHKRDEYPGTGIGLSVCKRIIERHGGRIWVESTPGKGSVFYFTIPAG
ncbi:MAG: ATP-binding protein, partial [Dissulfurispiraceae bacterium]